MPNSVAQSSAIARVARKWILGGRVQGVGYRPFVYRVAHRCGELTEQPASRAMRTCHGTLIVIDLLKFVLESQALTWMV